MTSPGRAQQYDETWESLKQYQVPEWFQDAKFGIVIHWGLYTVAIKVFDMNGDGGVTGGPMGAIEVLEAERDQEKH